MLLVFDWDRALVATNLVLRPVLDALFLNELGMAMRRLGDELDALILDNLERDSQRHDRWTVALSKFLVAEDGNNRTTLRRFAGAWTEPADEIIEAGARLLATGTGLKAQEVAERVRNVVAQLQRQAGLGHDA
jgi:toluene monooxygenase system protein E